MDKRINRIFIYFFTAVAIFFLLFLVFRNSLLNWVESKAATQLKVRTGASLHIKELSFSGLSSLAIRQLDLVPQNGDTLIRLDTLNLRLSFLPLLIGTVRVKQIYCSGAAFTVSCRDSICNYQSLLLHRNAGSAPAERNYASFFKRMLDRSFNLAPQRATLNNVSLVYRNDSLEQKIIIDQFISDENSVSGIAKDVKHNTTWMCNGSFSQAGHSITLNIFPSGKMQAFIPLIKDLFHTAISFDTLHVALNGYRMSGDALLTDGNLSVNNFSLCNRKVSADTVKVPSASVSFIFRAGREFVEIDSATIVSISMLEFSPYVKYANKNGKSISVNIRTPKTKPDVFFSSLPQGVFDEVRDLSGDGTLQYTLQFHIDMDHADSLIFDSSLRKEKFRLKKFGAVDLLKMNRDFIYSVYEGDRYIRSFIVGPANPSYTPLDKISQSFINAVLTSEDGNFYFHNGFNEDAFRKSIITNIKAGKFVRGGSTISMQLVKNVFLNRKKTVARKAEEALLVWMIESNRLTSKERMLEVYMNIIELGPGIYGVGEASSFYFNKKPEQLTLPEGIFLASLLPHPKWFKYSFDTLGNLKPYLADYYRVVSDFMLRRNLITQDEHDQLQPHIVLNGPAREMIIPSDTIPEEEDGD